MPRIPTSDAAKRLNGNPGHRKLGADKSVTLAARLPAPAAELSDEAKAVFRKTGKIIQSLGLSPAPDTQALTRYAENTVIIRRAHRELATEPLFVIAANGSRAPHPAIRMCREFEPLLMKFESENGLTAASRARLGIQVEKVEEPDSFTMKYLRP